MPELPEVETTCRGIEPHINQRSVSEVRVRQPQLRWPVPSNLSELIKGQTVRGVTRRGKYVLVGFDNGELLIHLGMSGSLRVLPENTPAAKHDHVELVFDTGMMVRLTDPRRFGAVLWQPRGEIHTLLASLGPEPLTPAFDPDHLAKACKGRSQAIKLLIMNSHVVVGVGNIYANEALFKAGIDPRRAAGKISKARLARLVDEIKTVLSYAITRGGTTLRDFLASDGKPGYFAQELSVYGRGGEPCKHCAKLLKEVRLGQRSTVFCTQCQR
ncbi:MAG TPA: bifunctional DNA-formamidopyrimidine glycosylase/DNA-(apurinic or apyrimidinic site) lyase [Marinobacterium sp.]|nr:bifunctional DNA-formamidopyrimidine glycosylase/DNA-(apurinic or apyrimidinic site) lyase [Marinobacterium sp.]